MGESDTKEAQKVLDSIYSCLDSHTINYLWGNYHSHVKDLQAYQQIPDLDLYQEVREKFLKWQDSQVSDKDITSKL